MSPRRWGSRASAPIGGWPASMPRATPACTIVVATASDADHDHRRGRGRGAGGPARASSRPGLARPRARRPGSDREPDPAPPRRAPPGGVRPDDRRGDPRVEDHRGSLRAGPAGRAGPHGRQEDRADPRRRRLASPRPRDGQHRRRSKKPGSGSTTSTPLVDDHSRFAYSEILGDEQGRHLRRVLRPSRRVLRRPRHHPHRSSDDRQPLELHAQPQPSPTCSPTSAPTTC